MHRFAFLLCLASTAALAGQDPLKSEACARALAALEAARQRGPAQEVQASRAAATQACLGGSGAAVRPSPVLREPQAVAPPVITPPARPAPPVTRPPAAPVEIERPAVVTTCDDAGCWDGEGRRLNRAGPVLIGPGGPCVGSGVQVQCP